MRLRRRTSRSRHPAVASGVAALSLLSLILPLGSVAALTAGAVVKYAGLAHNCLAGVISEEAARYLGTPVRVGRVTLSRGGATAEDIHIGDPQLVSRGMPHPDLIRVSKLVCPFPGDLFARLQRSERHLIERVEVTGGHVSIARDRHGRWNFAPLLKPSKGPPGRAWIGEVRVRDVTVRYTDAALPKAEGRADRPVVVRAARAGGSVFLANGGRTSWTARLDLGSGAGELWSTGRYEATGGAWHCVVGGRSVRWPEAADRFLPPGIVPRGTRATGAITIIGKERSNRAAIERSRRSASAPLQMAASVSFDEGHVSVPWLRSPINVDAAHAVLNGGTVAVAASCAVRRAKVAARAVVNYLGAPTYRIEARVAAPDIRTALREVPVLDTYLRSADGLRGDGEAFARVSGRGSRALITANGSFRVLGRGPGGLVVNTPSRVLVSALGPLTAPWVRVGADVPFARVRGVPLYNTVAGVLVSNGKLYAGASARGLGGRIAASGQMALDGTQAFHADAAVRDVSVADLVQRTKDVAGPDSPLSKRLKSPNPEKLSGLASADLSIEGDAADRLRLAKWNIQVLGINIDTVDLDAGEMEGHIRGDQAVIERVRFSRGAAEATASGTVRLDNWTGHIEVEGDGWSLGEILRWAGVEPETRLAGRVSLRNGVISGDLRRPDLRGTIYGSGIEAGSYRVDYAIAAVEGTPDNVILDGEAVRVPSVATVNGFIRRPFTPQPWLALSLSGHEVDLADIAMMADGPASLAGLASAQAYIGGPITDPEVSEFSIESERVWLGDVMMEGVRGTGSARMASGKPAIELSDVSMSLGSGRVSGSAQYVAGTFDATARMDAVPVEALGDLTSAYAELKGNLDAEATLSGWTDEDGQMRLKGSALLRSSGLTVNGEDLGDLAGRAILDGDSVQGHPIADAGPSFRWGHDGSGLAVEAFRYDLNSRQFELSGAAQGLQIDALRRAAARSPALTSGAGGDRVLQVLEALTPVRGSFDLAGRIAGTPDDWLAHARFDGAGLSVERLRADAFTGLVEATNEQIKVRDIEFRSGEALVSGEAQMRIGEEVRGSLSAQNLDLALLAQWFPPEHPIHRLSGTLDTISAEIGGNPEAPLISVSMGARDVAVKSQGSASTAPPLVAPAIRLSSATVREGLLSLDDLAITLSAGRSSQAETAVRPLEIHVSGEVPFTWKAPYIADDARGEMVVRLPETDLKSVQALMAGASVDMSGALAAEIRIGATRADLNRISEGDAASVADTLDVSGSAWIKADQVRAFRMRTVLGDVDLRASIEQGKIALGSGSGDGPAARVFTLDSGGSKRTEAGSISISGRLPVSAPASAGDRIVVRVPRLTFDEAPFPGFTTGRAAGVLTGIGTASDPATSREAEIVVSGSMLQPRIAGSARLEKLAIRLPVTEATPRVARAIPAINPTFDLNVHVAGDAMVRSNQLNVNMESPAGRPIRISGSLGEPRVAGVLAVKGGTLTFPTARFTIRRGGTVTLRYPAAGALGFDDAGLDVAVDVTAQTRMSAESVTGQTKRYLLTVDARGPLLEQPRNALEGGGSKLKLTYRSDPPDLALSQEGLARRITALLGGQDALNAVFSRQGDAGSVLVGKVVDYLGGALMPDLVDQSGVGRALGLSELNVDYSRAGAFVLRLSRDLHGPFEVGFWKHISGSRSTLSDQGDWELRLSARLVNRFRLSWTLDDQRTNVYRLEGVYSF